eukprot:916316_1
MSLTKAIQFRLLVTQLTNDERVGFLSKLIDSHTHLILASLFEYFTEPDHIHKLNDFNQSLSDIIQSRKEKPKTICTRNIQLPQFPRAIIGYVASFLNQWDYCDFSHCNRSTYLGCNSPNLLQKLDLTQIADYSFIKLALFPSVKSLSIDASKVDEIDFDSHGHTLNQVSELRLHANSKHGWVQSFLHANVVNPDTVTTIECLDFGRMTDRMDKTEFLNLLTAFPNIQRLSLTCVRVTRDITAQVIAKACPRAVGLSLLICLAKQRSNLVQIFANQLQYLTLRQHKRGAFDFDHVDFGTLNELCFDTPGYEQMECILKSAINLKKILIRFDSVATMVPSNGWMSNNEIKTTIINCMVKCTFVNDMHFVMNPSQFWSISEGIEYGLFKTQKQPKKQLRICIKFNKEIPAQSTSDFVLHVGRMVNILETSMTTDFMLIFHLSSADEEVKDIFMALENLLTRTKIFEFRDVKKIFITNTNCRINGCVGYRGFGINIDVRLLKLF